MIGQGDRSGLEANLEAINIYLSDYVDKRCLKIQMILFILCTRM